MNTNSLFLRGVCVAVGVSFTTTAATCPKISPQCVA
jgi:hypothetical protein